MVSSVISQKGSARTGEFSRCDEYIYFVMFGAAGPATLADDMLHAPSPPGETVEVEWGRLGRNGANGRRTARPNLFYPIFLDVDGRFHSTGAPIPLGVDRNSISAPDNTVAVFPVLTNGQEMSWALSREKLNLYAPRGYLKFGAIQPAKHQKAMVYYLTSGYVTAAEAGTILQVGTVDAPRWVHTERKNMKPMSVWTKVSHDAGWHGSRLLSRFLPDRKFPFPKSLYAVEDALRFFLIDKPAATVLDYFAGSGTTAHAVMRLNREDNGHRRCVSVTNNEVSAEEQTRLRAEGFRPGDDAWQEFGICDYITKPRLTAAITGKCAQGEPITGEYKFNDEFPMFEGFEENAAFFTLTYEGPLSVAHHRAFARIAPMLWLRAGARGEIISGLSDKGWDVADNYGVLDDLDASAGFVARVKEKSGVHMVFIVTDDDLAFQMVCRELPARVRPVRLYESYLQNFEINSGRFA